MTDQHELAAPYALNALEPDERTAFEDHLASCPSCRAEVAEVTTTIGELSALDEASPSPALRANVLGAIGDAAPSPALRANVLGAISDAAPAAARTSRPRRAQPEPTEEPRPPADELALRRQRRRTRVLGGLVAALVALAVALGGVVYGLARERQALVAEATIEQQLYAASDAVTTTSALPDGGQITLVSSKQLNRALFLGTDLPDPGTDRYQLWTASGPDRRTLTRAVPDVQVAETGPGVKVFFTGDVAGADYLAVNLEPAGSTPQTPTGSLLAVGPTSR